MIEERLLILKWLKSVYDLVKPDVVRWAVMTVSFASSLVWMLGPMTLGGGNLAFSQRSFIY